MTTRACHRIFTIFSRRSYRDAKSDASIAKLLAQRTRSEVEVTVDFHLGCHLGAGSGDLLSQQDVNLSVRRYELRLSLAQARKRGAGSKRFDDDDDFSCQFHTGGIQRSSWCPPRTTNSTGPSKTACLLVYLVPRTWFVAVSTRVEQQSLDYSISSSFSRRQLRPKKTAGTIISGE